MVDNKAKSGTDSIVTLGNLFNEQTVFSVCE